MDVSDLSSDWDIVSSMSAGDFEGVLHEEGTESALHQKSFVDETVKKEGCCVEDVPELSMQSESNSSSDIDVIDEGALEDSNISSIPSMDFSITSSIDGFKPLMPPLPSYQECVSGQAVDARPPPTSEDNSLDEDSSISPNFMNESSPDIPLRHEFSMLERMLRDPTVKRCGLLILLLSVTLLMLLDCPLHLVRQMEKRVTLLQAENDQLKQQVERGPLLALEEEIRALKGENSKLSGSMKDLVFQMEEQNTLFKKESDAREKEFHRGEIDRLREQINILQIDNEELQKQLVRIRYGIYSPHAREEGRPSVEEIPAEDDSEWEQEHADTEPEEEEGRNEAKVEAVVGTLNKEEMIDDFGKDKTDNATEILNNEIKELRRKLYSEVEKLKNWKESVQHLMEKLKHDPEGMKFENEKHESGKGEHTSEEEEPQHKKGHKKKFFEWNLGDLHNNLKHTMENLQEINVPEFISQYMNVDRKKMKGVFESVGHYFKKAQEKTKKMFNYKDKKENEVWNFLGDLRRKWHDVKKEFFRESRRKASRSSTHQEEGDATTQFQKVEKDSATYSDDSLPKTSWKFEESSNEKLNHIEDLEGETLHTDHVQKDVEEGHHKSWLLKRAEQRSELREEEKEELPTNWFLRKGREAHQNDHN